MWSCEECRRPWRIASARSLIEVTPASWIDRIILEETDGSSTEFRFQGQTEDGKIDDQSFRFAVPPGVEVIDGNFAP